MENTVDTQYVMDAIETFLGIKEEPEDGLDGDALNLVISIPKLNGEEFTDGECLELVRDVVNHWKGLTQ